MSRRQTSARMLACANEAKVAHDTHSSLHAVIVKITQDWGLIPDQDKLAALQEAALSHMPTTILNSLTELAHFRLDGKRITQERIRRQSKRAGEALLDTSEPDVHPYPQAKPETIEDFIGTPEEREEFEKWNQ